ncbi:hypothetical protein RQZ10_01240, partial [Streptococcus pneumoniae]|nr:hypothetical protein [Streptococcus pneumoniae]
KKHPLGEKRNHPGSKLRQGFWMVFRFGVNNWGFKMFSTTYRNHRKRFGLRMNLIAGIINHELGF